MPKPEQQQFVNDLIDNVKQELLALDYPENWDGIEFRWLIADRFSQVVFGDIGRNKRSKRYRDYLNDIRTKEGLQ